MLDVWFFFLLAITVICFLIGWFSKSSAFFSLGSILLMGSGLVLMTQGIMVPSAYNIVEHGDTNSTFADTNYSLWLGADCPQNVKLIHPSISICAKDLSLVVIGNIFLYGGIVALLVSFVLIFVSAKRVRS